MDVVPVSLVGIVQDCRGPTEILETILGDGPTRNIQKMFGRKDEMEVERFVAAEDNGETAILLDPAKFPVEFGKGRP